MLKKIMAKKLNSKKGESLSEVLVSILVSALGLVILASMIISATNMIQRSRANMGEYYRTNNDNIEAISSEAHTGEVSFSLPSNVVYGLKRTGEKLEIVYTENKINDAISVIFYRLRGGNG